MPRDGSGVYSTPSGTMAITNTPIPSTPYNTNVNDVAQDLNVPRPIVAGGTGANNAHDAMLALGGEIATQTITNYDSFPFVSGSFYSAPGATSAPNSSNAFVGTVLNPNNDPGYITLEACALADAASGVKFIREKIGGVWGAWVTIASPNDKVSKAGDTMTGGLNVGGALNVASIGNFVGQVNITQAGQQGSLSITGNVSDVGVSLNNTSSGGHQWQLLSSGGATGLGNGFHVWDATAGAIRLGIDNAGAVVIGDRLTVSQGINAPSYLIDGSVFAFHSSTYHVINDPAGRNVFLADGAIQNMHRSTAHTFYNATGVGVDVFYASIDAGGLNVNGNVNAHDVTAAGSLYSTGAGAGLSFAARAGGATMFLHNNTGQYNFYDVTNARNFAVLDNGGFTILGNGGLSPVKAGRFLGSFGTWSDDNTTPFQARGGDPSNTLWVGYNPSGGTTSYIRASGQLVISEQGYKPGGGVWGDSSDERIKDVLGDYEQGLLQILKLKPKRFKYKANDTTDPPDEPAAPYQKSLHHGVIDREFIGLIAQDTEETMPEMVSQREGYIDGQHVTDLRNIDTTPLIFALINAVKTLTARLDQLEAGRA